VSDNSGDVNPSPNPCSETPDDEYSGWTCYMLSPDSQDDDEEITDETVNRFPSGYECRNTN